MCPELGVKFRFFFFFLHWWKGFPHGTRKRGPKDKANKYHHPAGSNLFQALRSYYIKMVPNKHSLADGFVEKCFEVEKKERMSHMDSFGSFSLQSKQRNEKKKERGRQAKHIS